MVLRPDEPILYDHVRARIGDSARDSQHITLIKTYRLLLVALPLLVAIAFPTLKGFIAIAAAVLGANFLWLLGTHGKWVGRETGFSAMEDTVSYQV